MKASNTSNTLIRNLISTSNCNPAINKDIQIGRDLICFFQIFIYLRVVGSKSAQTSSSSAKNVVQSIFVLFVLLANIFYTFYFFFCLLLLCRTSCGIATIFCSTHFGEFDWGRISVCLFGFLFIPAELQTVNNGKKGYTNLFSLLWTRMWEI